MRRTSPPDVRTGASVAGPVPVGDSLRPREHERERHAMRAMAAPVRRATESRFLIEILGMTGARRAHVPCIMPRTHPRKHLERLSRLYSEVAALDRAPKHGRVQAGSGRTGPSRPTRRDGTPRTH